MSLEHFLALSRAESAYLVALAEEREPTADAAVERHLADRGLLQFSGTRDVSHGLDYQTLSLTPGGAQVAGLLRTAVSSVGERRIAALEAALREIQELADGMPNGADHEADPENESPEDAGYHVAGLIWRCAENALKACA